MKTISLLLCISLFINGAETDEIESVSVMLWDSVTLHTNIVIQRDDEIEWMFGDKKNLLARIKGATNSISFFGGSDGRFRDRLKINNHTGDLTFIDILSEHIGVYKAVLTVDIVKTKTFRISGVFGDAGEVKSVERDSVTLHTNVTELQRYDGIQWMFHHGNSPLAEINRTVDIFSTHDDVLDGRFKDKIKLDVQTGSLTIKNIRNKHSGFYQVDITSNNRSHTIHKSFTVTVRDEVKSVSVMGGDSVTLRTDTQIQTDDRTQWIFVSDDSLIAEIYKTNKIFKTYVGDDERFKERLKLNFQSGDLIITKSNTEDTGLYELKISSRRRSIHRRFTVTVIAYAWYFEGLIGVSSILVILSIVGIAGVIWYKKKNRDQCDKKPVAVIGGGPVTLQTGVKDLHRNDGIEWKYQNILIAKIKRGATTTCNGVDEKRSSNVFCKRNIRCRKARYHRNADEEMGEINPSLNSSRTNDKGYEGLFSNKLELNPLTGDLTLNNLKNEHYGDYKLKTTISGKTTYKTFYLFDVGIFEMLTVNNGDSVSLKTGIETDGVIVEWRFGKKAAVIAEINSGHNTPKTYNGNDDLFKDKLTLNPQTGDLTIIDISKKHCGAYRLKIINNDGETTFKSFFVSFSIESKTVVEGESPSLYTNVTDIQRGDVIEWMFGDEETLIAEMNSPSKPGDDNGRFRSILLLNKQTGDLTINNIKKKHSGDYKLKIIKGGKTSYNTFNVLVMEDCEIMTVNEGHSVPLKIGIQTDDVTVEWRCEENVAIIAEINFAKNHFRIFDGDDGLFKDKLEFNRDTGVLTINDIREKHYGLYRQKIISNGEPMYKTLCVFVSDNYETVSVMEGESVSLYTNVSDIQREDLIEWSYQDEETLIAEINSPSKPNDDNEEFRNTLQLNKQTGDLTIPKIMKEHSGNYKLKIIKDGKITYKTFKVSIMDSYKI
ncbi:uncharacterized protein LOC130548462 [Triplophysa rosa]|uniref:uncharacterized protein LOC130548462 n=1 Tax=Triplophysa rosa TaxID=992332 RepID=UPI002545E56A|nr:uncharacterized protein LOC130548462 [Triplophysa rosa]XP_057181225.1 uncharacterized protein LOC130548462 [Triplophysa rosa]XP_057181226.1 uncharacterized protein LOC130548462 [Triplophysa rosa]XP_057181227.1 uncharacterized protein LOC130548462 [Triplophysa rosa]